MWFPRTAPPARKGTDPERDAVYLFKHALLQDAAHETLFRSRRRELHTPESLQCWKSASPKLRSAAKLPRVSLHRGLIDRTSSLRRQPHAHHMRAQPLRSPSSLLAATRRCGGRVRPSELAVLRLTISSKLVGCSTGRSSGFAPFRIELT